MTHNIGLSLEKHSFCSKKNLKGGWVQGWIF